MKIKTLFTLCLACFSSVIWCQNTFYNGQQFGLQSTLLGGTVTSGNGDLSMAYYNPAALHLAEQSADISVVQPRVKRFGFGEYFGSEANSTKIDLNLSPSLVSFKLKLSDKINLIIITIQKSKWDNSVKSQSINDINGVIQEQVFKYGYSGDDRWYGTGGSFQVNKNISFGISQFFSNAKYGYSHSLSSNTVDKQSNQILEHFSDKTLTSWSNKSLITKFGVHISSPRHSLGLVVKSPNYFIILSGGAYEREITEISTSASTINSKVDFNLTPRIKTPWELNIGYAFTLVNGSKIWWNSAYYSTIKDYNMATIQPGRGNSITWRNGTKQVTNFSIGYSGILSPSITLITSIRTDFIAYENSVPGVDEERIFVLDDDRYHFSIGTNFKISDKSVLVGLDFGFTRLDNSELFEGFPNIDRFDTTQSEFNNSSLTLMLTYGY